jgi:hypothetical protein
VALCLAAHLAAAGAAAQSFDAARYDALVAECDALLGRVESTLEAGDLAMAQLFLDLGGSACEQAAGMVRSVWTGLDESVRDAHFDAVFRRETRLAELWVGVGSCERGARVFADTLQLEDSIAPAWASEVAGLAAELLRCLPPGGLSLQRRVALGEELSEAWLLGALTAFVWQPERLQSCPGVFPFPPSYRLELSEAGRLTVELHAGRGYRLAVVRGNAVHCGSGESELYWLELDAEPGTYDVLVGYRGPRSPLETSFGVALSLHPTAAAATGPSHGVARLSPEAPQAQLRGHTVGVVSADERYGAPCGTWVPEVPNHRLELDSPAEISVVVTSAVSDDLSLVIAGGGVTAWACPGQGAAAALEVPLGAGSYSVFVGESVPWGTGYDIAFGLVGAGGPAARLATLSLPRDGPSHWLEGVAPLGEEAVRRPDCPGFYAERPDLVLELTETGDWGVMVEASANSTLVVLGPGGVSCNDDFAGWNPGVFQTFEPGEYRVFVGARTAATGFPFRLSVVRER